MGRLKGDSYCKFTFKESLVEQVEQLVQIAGCPVVGGQLLHSETPFVSINCWVYMKKDLPELNLTGLE